MKLDNDRQCTECGRFEQRVVMLDSSGINKAYICLDCLNKAKLMIHNPKPRKCWFCGEMEPNHHPMCQAFMPETA